MSDISTYKKILEKYDAKRENLVTAFQDIQEAEGYISPEAIAEVSKYFDISRADAYSVVSFYAQFKFKKPGKHIIKVCKELLAMSAVQKFAFGAGRALGNKRRRNYFGRYGKP
ncbi:MAG: NAD(P)H-dependent oxidoreductase subunit E [Bacilli bacterium]